MLQCKPRVYCRQLVQRLRRIILDPATRVEEQDVDSLGLSATFHSDKPTFTVAMDGQGTWVTVDSHSTPIPYLLSRWRLRRAVFARLAQDAVEHLSKKPQPSAPAATPKAAGRKR